MNKIGTPIIGKSMDQLNTKPNIIFIVIDALRARNLGCYGYDRPTSPVIDSLAAESARFSNCFSTINVTDPSFTTILSGNYPVTHGLVEQGVTDAKIYSQKLQGLVMLPSILKENGYITIGVDWLGRWHKTGFDYYSGALEARRRVLNDFTIEKIKKNRVADWGINLVKKVVKQSLYQSEYGRANLATDYALKTVGAHNKKRFFLFMHYWDVHIPYNPPRAHLKQFTGKPYNAEVKEIGEVLTGLKEGDWKYFIQAYTRKMKTTDDVLARYDGGIHYVDSEIGRLLKGLEEQGVMENTLVIITADHGESLTEHGIYFDHHGLYDELIHVPLIMHYPGIIAPRRIDTTIQHIDLVPTVLELAGIGSPLAFDGKSLAPLLTGQKAAEGWQPFVFVEEARSERKFAIRTRKYKYIFALSEKDATCDYCGRIHGGVEELFDLENDPGEKTNIVDRHPEIRNQLRTAAMKFREGLEARRKRRGIESKIDKMRVFRKGV